MFYIISLFYGFAFNKDMIRCMQLHKGYGPTAPNFLLR